LETGKQTWDWNGTGLTIGVSDESRQAKLKQPDINEQFLQAVLMVEKVDHSLVRHYDVKSVESLAVNTAIHIEVC